MLYTVLYYTSQFYIVVYTTVLRCTVHITLYNSVLNFTVLYLSTLYVTAVPTWKPRKSWGEPTESSHMSLKQGGTYTQTNF